MPVGLVVMRWDERVGTEILAKHPEEINVTDKTLMQVYSTHEYSGESGMISLMVGALNIASYYTGPEKGFYILLLLSLDDDPDSYEGGLADASRVILQNIEDESFIPMIPSLFQRISVYPTLNKEQRIAMTYQDDIKRMIINRLREEGAVSKSELLVWLKDKYKRGFVDLEGVLIDLIKRELIKETSVKGMPSELVFLTNDILMIRTPPAKLLEEPSEHGLPLQLSADYQLEVKKFFQSYRPTEEDTLRVLEAFTNPQVYETLRLLRTAVVTRNDLEKLKKKGVEDVDDVLKSLWDNKMIQVFQDDKNNEYYALISDIYIDLIFPKYLLNVIKSEYDQRSKAEPVLLEYLNVLEDSYMSLKSSKKSERTPEEKERAKAARREKKAAREEEKARLKAEKEKEKARLKEAKGSERAVQEEEKAKLKAAREEEKARLKAAREEEKARLKAAKEEEKARLKAAREEEKARLKAAKEEEKEI